MSLVMLCSSDVFELINYFSLILWLSIAACIVGLLYLRYREPNMPRPIRVHLALPISFLICCLFLISIPAVAEPVNTGEDIYIDDPQERTDCRLLDLH
jgi:amino acid transporter